MTGKSYAVHRLLVVVVVEVAEVSHGSSEVRREPPRNESVIQKAFTLLLLLVWGLLLRNLPDVLHHESLGVLDFV